MVFQIPKRKAMVQFGMEIVALYVFPLFCIMAQTNAPSETKNPTLNDEMTARVSNCMAWQAPKEFVDV